MAFKQSVVKAPKEEQKSAVDKEFERLKEIKEREYIAAARGETGTVDTSLAKATGSKNFTVVLPLTTIDRLKRYWLTEAKRIESQNYIVNEAIHLWLDNKGFEK